FLEAYYRQAREKGVQFITYRPDQKPEVRVEGDEVSVLFHEPVLDRTVEVSPDLLVLSTGVVPSDIGGLANRLGLTCNSDGFFQEIDSKWRPVDLNRPGVFAAGLAVAPCNMAEALMQSRAAAMRAVNILSKDVMTPARAVSDVKQSLCSVCETCVQACPYEARYKEEGRIKVIASACQGCGICVAACPNGAAWLPVNSERQTMGVLEGLLEGVKWG
ncbi:MAG: 4Fe-4S binding protein, partial [Deltaproteobacteria bacterium]|nr:4Fe-4S binding protein [Deltaproteobacteria bacterium]